MTSLADMLRMTHVCEGTVHSEEISKQHLESIKTVKQVKQVVEAIQVTAGPSPGSLVGVQIVDPVTHLRSVRPMARNVFTATRKDILASFVVQNNVASLLDQM